MYTHKSISNVRKISTSTLLAILLVSAIVASIPLGVVHGIAGGAPKLGILHQTGPDSAPVVTAAVVGTTFVNATAGNIGAKVDNLACAANCGNLTIFFSVGATNLVTFSGAQFNIYISKDGFSLLSPTDIKYAGSFLVSSLNIPLVGVTEQNGTYYVGTTTSVGVCTPGCKVVEGPLPIQIPGGYKFIKVWDGTAVAALQYLTIAPGIRLIPTTGPANTPVQVLGGGFIPNTLIDLNYSYTFHAWPAGGASVKSGQWQTSVSTTSNGYFTYTYNMIDTKQAVNPTGGPFNDVITITAVKHTYPHTALANIAPATPAIFTEKSRVFTQLISFNQRGDLVVNNTAITYYGNDTGIAPILPQQSSTSCYGGPGISVYATGKLWLAGNWWTWGGTVTFWVSNGTSTGFNPFSPASTTAGATSTHAGSFGLNLTIPTNLPIGTHTVKVVSNGVAYTFYICMRPTLVLTPHQGTASYPDTTVTVTAYGFPVHKLIILYWNETSFGDGLEFNIANFTTGSNGQINGSTKYPLPITFKVPETYGGDHNVSALLYENIDAPAPIAVLLDHGDGTCSEGSGTPEETFCEELAPPDSAGVASALFTVLPSFVVIPGSFNSTYNSPVKAIAEGLIPGIFYSVDIDNQQADFSTTFIIMNETQLTLHGPGGGGGGGTITIGSCTRSTGRVCHLKDPSAPNPPLLINYVHGLVTPNGVGQLNLTFIGAGFRPGSHVISLNAADENLSAGNYFPDAYALFTVTTAGDAIANMLASMTTTLNSITTTLSSISSSLAGLSSSVSALQTSVNNLQTSVNTLSTTVGGIQTTVNGIVSSVNSHTDTAVAGLQSSLTSLASDVTNIKSTVGGIASSVNSHTDTAVGGIAGIGNTANSILSAVQAEQTYVLVVAVLAAITLVLVLAVLIRKLS